jgi:hypothetical protein
MFSEEESSMPSSNRRGGRNNNPTGRNQYSGLMSSARDNPLATAAAVGGAVAAGVFLWSRRNQISDQIGNLAGQIGDWREGLTADSGSGEEEDGAANGGFIASSGSAGRRGRRTQAEISEEALTLKETGKAMA